MRRPKIIFSTVGLVGTLMLTGAAWAVQPVPAGLAARVEQLEAQVAALEAVLQFLRVEPDAINGLAGPSLIIEGANVHVRSGSGATDDGGSLTGLGNLVVGYNEDASIFVDRSGSHNLVVGPEHTYSSFGGLVAGSNNAVTGGSASVSGGSRNVASGEYASVSGGNDNNASGDQSSVSGGEENNASGVFSSVSGGDDNRAIGDRSSVSGGTDNRASGTLSSVSGGDSNEAIGAASSVSGGFERTAPNIDNWAAGGLLEPN
jgi:hypothetical protein